jgi:serine/threonine protein kinase
MQESPKRRSVRTTLPAGTRVGRYTIVDRIGAGGMAELFLARQDGPRGFAKPIALKLLHAHIGEDPEFVAMFEREARVAAALVHPHVVQVLDIGVAEDEHFLALEFVHGRDLRRILVAQRGPLPLGPALRVVTDVAKALHYVHTRCDPHGRPLDLVHRDVSPANVLVGFAGSVKLADFGIAKAADQTAHTRTGTLKGKFGYMAPEQCLQQGVDARSDLFALGVVLYEATTGRRLADLLDHESRARR